MSRPKYTLPPEDQFEKNAEGKRMLQISLDKINYLPKLFRIETHLNAFGIDYLVRTKRIDSFRMICEVIEKYTGIIRYETKAPTLYTHKRVVKNMQNLGLDGVRVGEHLRPGIRTGK